MSDPRLARYLDLWQLVPDGAAFETPSSWLLFVRQHQTPAVLKLPKPASDEQQSASALAHYAGRGAVRLLAHDESGVLLMERAIPGTELAALSRDGRDAEATQIFCDVVESLHTRKPPQRAFKTLDDLAAGFVRYAKNPRPDLLPPPLVARAEDMFRELCASQGEPFLLHGDLHHMNMLRDSRGWLAIDPKGIIGELAYETASLLHNPIPDFEMIADENIMEGRVRILSDRLQLDRARILRWCFAKNILGHLWTVEDRHDDGNFPRSLRVAQTALALLGE